jgi:hypothetical protein
MDVSQVMQLEWHGLGLGRDQSGRGRRHHHDGDRGADRQAVHLAFGRAEPDAADAGRGDRRRDRLPGVRVVGRIPLGGRGLAGRRRARTCRGHGHGDGVRDSLPQGRRPAAVSTDRRRPHPLGGVRRDPCRQLRAGEPARREPRGSDGVDPAVVRRQPARRDCCRATSSGGPTRRRGRRRSCRG